MSGHGPHRHGGPAPALPRLLVVEDEAPLARLLAGYFEREGFAVTTCGDGQRGVIVLDLMLPGLDGIEACRQIRGFSDAYIVMLTARAEEADKIVGLSTGADDYVTKPFSPGELMARVRAMRRRPRATRPEPTPVRRFGDLAIDPAAREVRRGPDQVELTRLEFDLLDALSERPRMVLSRRQLLERVWGADWVGDEHLVEVHMANLRRKLDDDPRSPRYIRTVRGVGYRMGPGT
jgi:DNA-binding response OmpR family regulator